jgi:hypothetical protein
LRQHRRMRDRPLVQLGIVYQMSQHRGLLSEAIATYTDYMTVPTVRHAGEL